MSEREGKTMKVKKLKCPTCRGEGHTVKSNQDRPEASERDKVLHAFDCPARKP